MSKEEIQEQIQNEINKIITLNPLQPSIILTMGLLLNMKFIADSFEFGTKEAS